MAPNHQRASRIVVVVVVALVVECGMRKACGLGDDDEHDETGSR